MKKIISTLLLPFLCLAAYGQEVSRTEKRTDVVKLYFDQDSHTIDMDVRQNREILDNLADYIKELHDDSLSVITKIEINSYTSPEAGRAYNKKLSERRVNAVYDYLTNTITVPDSLIKKSHSGIDWDGLAELVEESNMEYKDEVLYILNNVPEETWRRVKPDDRWMTLVDSRSKHLMDLKWGNPYRYMYSNLYPLLRRGSVVTFYIKTILPPPPPVEIKEVEEPPVVVETPVAEEPKIEPIVEPEPEWISKPLFAVKTNLLYDAATVLNTEIEVPIGDRWSVALEWTYPWWKWDNGNENSNRNRIQLLNGNIEGRYWFGDRENRLQLTGWNLGLYAGGGKYDFERDTKGYQGEFYVTGLSGGYAHTINKKGNLRMEYTLGLGFLKTDYRYYEAMFGADEKWHAIRTRNGKYTWIGPTRARVSLVWMLNYKVKKGE